MYILLTKKVTRMYKKYYKLQSRKRPMTGPRGWIRCVSFSLHVTVRIKYIIVRSTKQHRSNLGEFLRGAFVELCLVARAPQNFYEGLELCLVACRPHTGMIKTLFAFLDSRGIPVTRSNVSTPKARFYETS
jgi:hypothetical protein